MCYVFQFSTLSRVPLEVRIGLIASLDERIAGLELAASQLKESFQQLRIALKGVLMEEDGEETEVAVPAAEEVDPPSVDPSLVPPEPREVEAVETGVKRSTRIPYRLTPTPSFRDNRGNPIYMYGKSKRVASRVIHGSMVLPRGGNFLDITIARPPSTAIQLMKRRLPGLNLGVF